MSRPPRDRSMETAAAVYAGRCCEISDLAVRLRGMDECVEATPNDDGPGRFAMTRCTDRIVRYYYPDQDYTVPYWQATPEEQEGCCSNCRARMEVVMQRWRLQRTLGGLKRALMNAYRREVRQ